MKNFDIYTINYRKTIREAFNKQGANNEGFIIITDDAQKAIGIVTDGDFRRAIWNSVSLEEEVDTIANRNFVYLEEDHNINDIKKMFSKTTIRHIPILKEEVLTDIIFYSNFEESRLKFPRAKIDVPVVIMAGRRGLRLDPFTRILPKPLIPVGGKPVIEIIINKFHEYGVNRFYISVNDKAKMIKAFFEDFKGELDISYIEEKIPLGTAGAIKFLQGKVESPFIVSNCDTIIEEDYSKILKFHKDGGYLLTLVGAMQHHIVPYGVCKIKNGGTLIELIEKPKYDFLVNTGMYIVNPGALEFIPHGKKFDTTELIELLRQNNKKIGVYPISEKAWIDIGQWKEYKKAVDKLQLFG